MRQDRPYSLAHTILTSIIQRVCEAPGGSPKRPGGRADVYSRLSA
ncbi:hypothetical protein CU044_1409 [Streptomyces sp. L-9-10]|nr:hypothetical protein CU044_1409 [Streptomyces sp. L-9-10]